MDGNLNFLEIFSIVVITVAVVGQVLKKKPRKKR